MKHLFLVNPTAGPYDRSHELTVKLSDQLDGLGLDWEVQVTQYPGHGAALARAAAEMGVLLELNNSSLKPGCTRINGPPTPGRCCWTVCATAPGWW